MKTFFSGILLVLAATAAHVAASASCPEFCFSGTVTYNGESMSNTGCSGANLTSCDACVSATVNGTLIVGYTAIISGHAQFCTDGCPSSSKGTLNWSSGGSVTTSLSLTKAASSALLSSFSSYNRVSVDLIDVQCTSASWKSAASPLLLLALALLSYSSRSWR